ncbi:MAG: nuclear transport factor 2 family protein, partial [Gemmatimonadetes bacterium]|nr:nuclear transport factor 2 family protein [Gemmatimonadota bacterium]
MKLFLEAYAAGGRQLTPVRLGADVDFICQDATGLQLGIDLTWLGPGRSPTDDSCVVNSENVLDLALEAARGKIASRPAVTTDRDYRILVLQMSGRPEHPTRELLDNDPSKPFEGLGYVEVWLMDHATLGDAGRPTLLAMSPDIFWRATITRYDCNTVTALERQWLDAVFRKDRGTLERLLSNGGWGTTKRGEPLDASGSCKMTGPDGERLSKWEYLDQVSSDRRVFDSLEHEDLLIEVHGDVFVVTGRIEGAWHDASGSQRSAERFTHIYGRVRSGWEMVGAHVSRIPLEPSRPLPSSDATGKRVETPQSRNEDRTRPIEGSASVHQLTSAARAALAVAALEAEEVGSAAIDSEHLFIGLCNEAALRALAVAPEPG